ncbi:MAG: hypothetical protein JXR95_11840 [Deltaproteobacteria bacterium]|nr:hypothetical protein [Deltaproteobacteria bacterium]
MSVTMLYFLAGMFLSPQAQNSSSVSSRAKDEITRISSVWTVSEKTGTVQYEMKLTLNGKSTGEIGIMRGQGTVIRKGKKVTITLEARLVRGKFLFLTKYPAIKGTFTGTKKSSNPELFPVGERVNYTETLILKKNELCPKSQRDFPNCLVPVKR